jgi:Zn-dependent peptidase ImmA (M78 family)
MAPRYSLARRRAKELLRRGRVKRAPVPIEKLAALLGATIKYEPFAGELYGMVHRNTDGSATIGVNSVDRATRQRFTIAHELGHLLLHETEELHIDEESPIGFRNHASGMAVDEREIEANQFAAELLMPAHMISEDVQELIEKAIGVDEAIGRLASKYNVSNEAMTIRLSALELIQL